MRRKRPELWERGDLALHHDNTPVHSALFIRAVLCKKRNDCHPSAPFSPDLAPADFFLFPTLKTPLKRRMFQAVDEIKQKTTEQLNTITKEEFSRAFDTGENRCAKFVTIQGEYFKRRQIQITCMF